LPGITLFSLVSYRAQFPAPDEVSVQVEEQAQAQVQAAVQAGKMVHCFLLAK
jgi:hypothetical protein